MSVKRRDLVRYLEENSFYLLREGGNHLDINKGYCVTCRCFVPETIEIASLHSVSLVYPYYHSSTGRMGAMTQ